MRNLYLTYTIDKANRKKLVGLFGSQKKAITAIKQEFNLTPKECEEIRKDNKTEGRKINLLLTHIILNEFI